MVNPFKKPRPLLAILLSTLLLSGCGFKLRGTHDLPEQLKTMHLYSLDRYSELARVLKSYFAVNGITLVQENSDKSVTEFILYKDKLDRRTLSLFPNGQVAEYGLIYSVKYAIAVKGQVAQPFEFEIYRDYQDDPQSALAKSKELKLILKEMRQQAADKIIRQMASFKANNR